MQSHHLMDMWAKKLTMAAVLLLACNAIVAQDSLSLEPAALKQFADEIVEPAIAASGVPGAIVTIVGNGRILLARAYGVADIESAAPVSPGKTLFNSASIGKTMTAVVALNLEEQGIVDFDKDVNTYLTGHQLTGGPITLGQLLVHQAGFETDLTGLLVPMSQSSQMTAEEINRRLHLLRTPVAVSSYDNVGFGLIGLVLQAASGKSLAELYREYIFEPLNLQSVAYPKPAADQQLATCYVVLGPGNSRECDQVHYRDVIQGAGGILISGEDMGKFMLAVLGQWPEAGRGMLSDAGLRKLLDFDNYRFHPGLPGVARSFFEFGTQPQPAFGHGGSVPGFSSILKIYPQAGVGVFVSYLGGQVSTFDATLSNVIGHFDEINLPSEVRAGMNAIGSLPDSLYKGLFGESQVQTSDWEPAGDQPQAYADGEPHPAELAGRYLSLEQSRQLIKRVMVAFSPLKIEGIGEDGISINGSPAYQRISPWLYQAETGNRIAFSNHRGQNYLALGMSIAGFKKVPWYSRPPIALLVLLAGCLLMFTSLPYLGPWSRGPARRFAMAACVGAVLCLGSLLMEAEWGSRLILMDGAWFLPRLWRLAFLAGLVILLLAAIRLWRSGPPGNFFRRLHLRILALVGLLVVAAAPLWGLVGNFLWL